MEKVSVIVITKDEELSLKECLESVKDFDEIIVVDSGSSDKTVDIAKEYTTKVFNREFDDFSSQKNFAIAQCKNNWVLSLDADEVVSKEFKDRIRKIKLNDKAGYRIKRDTYIFGKLLKYGGHCNDMPLRLFNKRKGDFLQPIHEFVKISEPTGLIYEPILHYSSHDLNEYIKKLNLYTDLEVKFLLERNCRFYYARMLLYPVLKFIQRYLLQRGFLDGFEGLAFYILSGFYEFVKWIKYREQIIRRC